MDTEAIYKKIENALMSERDDIIRTGFKILENPELGYREEKTSAFIRERFDSLGIFYTYPHAFTGVKAIIKGGKSKANVCVIGEMDSVKCAGYKYEGEYCAAHACGHNTQIAMMLGVAAVLKKSGVMDKLCGDVVFMAVPAEEFIELDYRKELRDAGKIKYFGGKQQLIYEGAFDDVDMAMMIHAQGNEPESKMYVRGNNLGFLAKTVTYKGKSVHASTPFDGVNALNAAALSILGIHSNRETFKDEDKIRIHPIITKGGDVVNSVPDEVCVETYVRGASVDAIKKGNLAVERSVDGACRMVGADYEVENIPGYLPISESIELSEVFEDVSAEILGKNNLIYNYDITGSTDIGDLSHIIPVIQPSLGGFDGVLHSRDFEITNPDTVYIKSVEILAKTIAELLIDDAKKAESVKNNFKPKMTKKQYIDYLDGEE